ncbi:ATP synthase mitochondrial F1 complex assembly factor 2 [Chrysoperla carnea]|uniref:ATP synthase mitochondrial F1 complex assembly factor 2 n=1 Tax=Chrysoperla carnea TaxID=189513 RepID=UPI001D06A7DA|nr:ATP synthase mitochondrial F1 complex assembly factor 2 [Chrysoperla carnea]
MKMNNLNIFTQVVKLLNTKNILETSTQVRKYAVRKRFYRTTGILHSGGDKYEITLDQRKLKTPNGKLFTVDNEALALAIAAEWDAQKTNIVPSTMHLTALCSTVIDNPNHLKNTDIADYVTNYIETDTVLFQSNDSEELYKVQVQEWDPIIEWFNKRYQTQILKTRFIDGPEFSDNDKNVLRKHLLSYNFSSLIGFMFAVDTLKSPILTLACVDRYLTPERAVLLTRLEEEFQLGHWGRVEWAHDLNQQELQARLAAAILFIHLNSSSSKILSKSAAMQ